MTIEKAYSLMIQAYARAASEKDTEKADIFRRQASFFYGFLQGLKYAQKRGM